jgi:hypothetical protein
MEKETRGRSMEKIKHFPLHFQSKVKISVDKNDRLYIFAHRKKKREGEAWRRFKLLSTCFSQSKKRTRRGRGTVSNENGTMQGRAWAHFLPPTEVGG